MVELLEPYLGLGQHLFHGPSVLAGVDGVGLHGFDDDAPEAVGAATARHRRDVLDGEDARLDPESAGEQQLGELLDPLLTLVGRDQVGSTVHPEIVLILRRGSGATWAHVVVDIATPGQATRTASVATSSGVRGIPGLTVPPSGATCDVGTPRASGTCRELTASAATPAGLAGRASA